MTQTQLVKLTLMLEARLEELSRVWRKREEITVERTPEVLDEIDLSVERDLAIWSLDKRFAQLRYVTAALPRALFCITCQESAEHDGSK